jgi:transcription factor WhiB
VRPPDWTVDAKCGGQNGSEDHIFFSEEITGQNKAARFCTGKLDGKPCPVQTQCLEWALETDSRSGCWGGIPSHRRHKMHVARAIPPADLGALIATRLNELGLSYRDAAEKSGGRISAATLSSIVNRTAGKSSILTKNTVEGLSIALEVDPNRLMSGAA